MKSTCYSIFLICLLLCANAIAYPISEKAPASGSAPLSILSSQPDSLFFPTSGDYAGSLLFSLDSGDLTIIDMLTFSENSSQLGSFESNINGVTLLQDGTTLILGLNDGNIAQVDLSDTDTWDDDNLETSSTDDETDTSTDSRVTVLSDQMTTAGIDFITASDDQNLLFMANTDGYFFRYNLTNTNFDEVQLLDTSETSSEVLADGSTGTTSSVYTPQALLFAPTTSGDIAIVVASNGSVLIFDESSTSYSENDLSVDSSYETPSVDDVKLSTDSDYLFILDANNNAVWVFSLITDSFVDQQSSGTSLDPIEIDTNDNSSLTHMIPFTDSDNNDVLYVSGASGLSVINVDSPGTSSSSTKVIDIDTADGESDYDPITLSATPGPLTTSTGYIFSMNGNATTSVLTENPWITLSSITPSSVTEDSSSFTLTFQADISGTYTIRANSDITGTDGTELISSTTLATADTDETTSSIDINDFARSVFIEGSNDIFVFVTDSSGNTGYYAINLSVDRPPEAVTINSVNFGNAQAYVNFDTSPDADIASYKIFAEPATSQTSPSCPGSLTFDTSSTNVATIAASTCGGSTCDSGVTELTNGTIYCIAVSVVDEGGQESSLATSSSPVTPELTVGPAGFAGESSCQLNQGKHTTLQSFIFFFLSVIPILIVRFKKVMIPLTVIVFVSQMAFAENLIEKTPQNWTLDVKGGLFIPTDSSTKSFVGTCCNLNSEVEFGYLFNNQVNVTFSSGFGYADGNAVSVTSGSSSGDTFSLLTIPLRLSVIYRFDYKPQQLFVPYVRAGADAVVFREKTSGSSAITNIKYGGHAGVGVGILLDRFEELGHDLENNVGVNDVYLILEGRYALINNFGGSGLDLSGFYPFAGVLFEF